MSQENVEIVRQTWNAYSERGIEAVLDYVAEDWVGEAFPDGVEGPWEGKAGVLERYRVFTAAWQDLVFEPVEFIDAGDNVVAVVAMRGSGKASGAPLDITAAYVYEIRDGEIVRDRPFTSWGQALEAVGLRE